MHPPIDRHVVFQQPTGEGCLAYVCILRPEQAWCSQHTRGIAWHVCTPARSSPPGGPLWYVRAPGFAEQVCGIKATGESPARTDSPGTSSPLRGCSHACITRPESYGMVWKSAVTGKRAVWHVSTPLRSAAHRDTVIRIAHSTR
jgi:hypothetical protein